MDRFQPILRVERGLNWFELRRNGGVKNVFRPGLEIVRGEILLAIPALVLIEQNLRHQIKPIRQGPGHIDPSQVAARKTGKAGARAERFTETVEKAEAATAEFLIDSSALFDRLVEDHHAERAFNRAALWCECAQIGASFVARTVRSLIEFHIQLQLTVLRIENSGDAA